jgi:hypothetical protein
VGRRYSFFHVFIPLWKKKCVEENLTLAAIQHQKIKEIVY